MFSIYIPRLLPRISRWPRAFSSIAQTSSKSASGIWMPGKAARYYRRDAGAMLRRPVLVRGSKAYFGIGGFPITPEPYYGGCRSLARWPRGRFAPYNPATEMRHYSASQAAEVLPNRQPTD